MKKSKDCLKGLMESLVNAQKDLGFLSIASEKKFRERYGEDFYLDVSQNGKISYEQVRILAMRKMTDSVNFMKNELNYYQSLLVA